MTLALRGSGPVGTAIRERDWPQHRALLVGQMGWGEGHSGAIITASRGDAPPTCGEADFVVSDAGESGGKLLGRTFCEPPLPDLLPNSVAWSGTKRDRRGQGARNHRTPKHLRGRG